MMWILDASVAIRWFLIEEADPAADSVLEEIISHPDWFAVPELSLFEVFAVLCRVHPKGASIFREGFLPLVAGGVLRHPMTESLALQSEPFLKLGLTGYDACYAALAKDLHGVWLTYDRKAHKRIRRQGISHLLLDGLPQNWPERPAS